MINNDVRCLTLAYISIAPQDCLNDNRKYEIGWPSYHKAKGLQMDKLK